jgi:hypothetical protein
LKNVTGGVAATPRRSFPSRQPVKGKTPCDEGVAATLGNCIVPDKDVLNPGCMETGIIQSGPFVMGGRLQFSLKIMHRPDTINYSKEWNGRIRAAIHLAHWTTGARSVRAAQFSNLIAEDGIVRRAPKCYFWSITFGIERN